MSWQSQYLNNNSVNVDPAWCDDDGDDDDDDGADDDDDVDGDGARGTEARCHAWPSS